MTATESLKRFVIRGQSLSGILTQQKNERLIPDINRAASILYDMGELGANPVTNANVAQQLRQRGRDERVIPDAVLEIKKRGLPWYEIRFNNELEKLIRTDKIQNLLQVLNAVLMIYQVKPEIIEAIDWYKLLKEINDNLDANNQIMLTETKFKENIAAIAEQRAAAAAIQAGAAGAQISKDTASAQKTRKEAADV